MIEQKTGRAGAMRSRCWNAVMKNYLSLNRIFLDSSPILDHTFGYFFFGCLHVRLAPHGILTSLHRSADLCPSGWCLSSVFSLHNLFYINSSQFEKSIVGNQKNGRKFTQPTDGSAQFSLIIR